MLNEYTGSAGNVLESQLIPAIRSASPDMFIILEANINPSAFNDKNIVLSSHWYQGTIAEMQAEAAKLAQ